jgi:hypothetical protein
VALAVIHAWGIVEALGVVAAVIFAERARCDMHGTSRLSDVVVHRVTVSRHARACECVDEVSARAAVLARIGRALIDVHSAVLLTGCVLEARYARA